jgi:hypothetical protein
MAALSESYAKTCAFVEAGKVPEAAGELASNFAPKVEELFGLCEQTYPPRFSKVDDWCTWIKQLVALSRRAQKEMRNGSAPEAAKDLELLRRHFYTMHGEAARLASNDFIYAFRTMLAAPSPDVAKLTTVRDYLGKAAPSAKASADKAAFGAARKEWAAAVAPVLAKGTGDAETLKSARAATEKFYRDYGIQFE